MAVAQAKNACLRCRTALRYTASTRRVQRGPGKEHKWRLSKHQSYQTAEYAVSTSAYRDDPPWDESARASGRGRKAAVNAAVYECVRIHPDGRLATVYLKRRDLLRLFALDPRDLRRIDPNLQYTRSSPTLYVRDNLILAQLAGARLIITASTSLLLDPHCAAARKLLGELIPKLQVTAGNRLLQGAMRETPAARNSSSRSHTSSHRHSNGHGHSHGSHGHSHGSHGSHTPSSHGDIPDMPFELDVVEATLHISISKLDAELVRAQALVQSCLQRLPRDITPQNLDELRKAKSALVELESKSDAYREMLEDIMDDEDELKDFNLSSRVEREERRRQRERGRLERELERERARDRGEAPDVSGGSRDWGTSDGASRSGETVDVELSTHAAGPRPGGARSRSDKPAGGLHGAERFGAGSAGQAGASARQAVATEALEEAWAAPSGMRSDRIDDEATGNGTAEKEGRSQAGRTGAPSPQPSSWSILNQIEAFQSYEGDSSEESSGAMMELRELFEQEEEKQDLQEVEDLFEFYLQRATSIQTEAERLLAGARDLEESIGLTLSARRFEVQRLELRLSIGSFAAALGAMAAGIFGMNLRSTLEESVIGFWGTTVGIVAVCVWVYAWILKWTRRKKILT